MYRIVSYRIVSYRIVSYRIVSYRVIVVSYTLTPVVTGTPFKGGGKTEQGLEGRDHANREAIE